MFFYCQGRAPPPPLTVESDRTPESVTSAQRLAAFQRVAKTYDESIGLDETVRPATTAAFPSFDLFFFHCTVAHGLASAATSAAVGRPWPRFGGGSVGRMAGWPAGQCPLIRRGPAVLRISLRRSAGRGHRPQHPLFPRRGDLRVGHRRVRPAAPFTKHLHC